MSQHSSNISCRRFFEAAASFASVKAVEGLGFAKTSLRYFEMRAMPVLCHPYVVFVSEPIQVSGFPTCIGFDNRTNVDEPFPGYPTARSVAEYEELGSNGGAKKGVTKIG